MTPSARLSAAIGILDQIAGGLAAEQALLRWSRASRYAGSGDRAAVRDLVFDALRRRSSYAAWGGGMDGRRLMLGRIRAEGGDPDALFSGEGHAPPPLTDAERREGGPPDARQAMNLPDWLMPLWSASLSSSAGAVAQAMAARAPVWLRVNAAKASPEQALAALAADDILADPDPHLPTALQVRGGERRVSASRAYRDGLVELQDLSPQLACAALPVAEGQRVLDYCAGGGGKALAIAARASVSVEAHDADPARMADLPNRASRAGADIRAVSHPKGSYDLVITDVPCSGSGTWRRSPDAKWKFENSQLNRIIEIQSQILSDVVPLVRPGGHLAYMTCSLLRDENEDRIENFLLKDSGFRLVYQKIWTPLDAGDGFFLALLQRR